MTGRTVSASWRFGLSFAAALTNGHKKRAGWSWSAFFLRMNPGFSHCEV